MSDVRRSILCVTSELPWPLDTGGHLRSFHLLQALTTAFRVRLVVPVTAAQQPGIESLNGAGILVRPALVPPRTVPG